MGKDTLVNYNKKVINAWAMYDWANSVYSLVITSTIFPIYYAAVTTVGDDRMVKFLGLNFQNSALYSYTIAFSFLLISILSPFLSGIADYGGLRKKFMQFFCYLGSLGCLILFFFTSKENIGVGIFGFVIATVGYAGSIVFYNSFLPEIAPVHMQDKVSAKGFAFGYIGSSILLIINLVMVLFPQIFGFSDSATAPRISFLMVGLWWVGFAQIPFRRLPDNPQNRKTKGNYLFNGFKELLKVLNILKENRRLKLFLSSFFFFNMGVQTVMYVAALFGEQELKLQSSELITTILIIQFVAIGGAYLFSILSSRFGNFGALAIAIIIWIGICIGAYHVVDANGFYALAFVVGMVMGGIQALSRSTYSKLLPETINHASFFSFYDVCERVGIVVGTAMYGIIIEITGSMRNSVIALALFFILGLVLLIRIPKTRVPHAV